MTRLLIAAGGTGGHIYPGLAVAREVAARHPDAEISFAGTERGLEREIVGNAGFRIHMLRAEPLRGGSLLRKLRGVLALFPALADARRLLDEVRPDVVFGVGGYSAGPLMFAAARRGIPTLLLEPNYEPGLANRWLARSVDRAAVAWEDTGRHFRGKAFVSGNPIRAEIAAVPDIEPPGANTAPGPETREGSGDDRSVAKGDEGAPGVVAPLRVLLLGGSQGSRPLNDAMIAALPDFPEGTIEITHQTGPADLERVRAAYADPGVEGRVAARVEPYLPDMDREYARCHVVVSRAGATTCAELAAAGRGAILVPLEIAGGHQRHNAEALARTGAARVIREAELDGPSLAAILVELAANPDLYVEMGRQARAHARPDAANRIVDELERLVQRSRETDAPQSRSARRAPNPI